MEEIWKEVENYQNYEVSNLGNVRNKKTGRYLKPNITTCGYARARLYNKDGVKPIMIHRLVASAFLSNPDNKPEVNHMDGNKVNNSVTNLEWCTKSENMRHAVDTGLKKGFALKGADNPMSKKVVMMDKSGEIIRMFPCAKSVERELGYFVSNIVNACNGKLKTSHGYRWAYEGGDVL